MIAAEHTFQEKTTATQNACRVCAPLGACLAFRGVEGSMSLLHGSQGCSTYIRRYMISHFKEPMDVASSNFSETTAIFGGLDNLRQAIVNVVRQYSPKLIGIATTCLAETIGDDVPMCLAQLAAEDKADWPTLVHVSTPAYSGSHEEGYHATVAALVAAMAERGPRHNGVNMLAPMLSPADLRFLKALMSAFGLTGTLLPDYSDTLDAPAWSEYQVIPAGGTSLADIRRMGSARATIEFGSAWLDVSTAGSLLVEQYGVPRYQVPLPIGVTQTDALYDVLEQLSGRPTPASHQAQRGRLIDSYVDAHKHVSGKRAVVYGEQDLVIGLAGLLLEIGITPVICASGTRSGHLRERIEDLEPLDADAITVLEGVDFAEIEKLAIQEKPDLIVGNSKGYGLSRRLGVPLVRVGFPVHDRMDGPRLRHLGYGGAQQLFDRITGALIETSQNASPVGYSYM